MLAVCPFPRLYETLPSKIYTVDSFGLAKESKNHFKPVGGVARSGATRLMMSKPPMPTELQEQARYAARLATLVEVIRGGKNAPLNSPRT
jgi:hypothetical protein